MPPKTVRTTKSIKSQNANRVKPAESTRKGPAPPG